MRSRAEHGLVLGRFVLGQSVRAIQLTGARARRRAVHVEPHARHAAGRTRIVAGAAQQAGIVVVLGIVLKSAERPVFRIAVDPHVVAVLDPQRLRVRRMDIHVAFVHERRTFVAAVQVAERSEQQGDHVRIDGRGVRAVAVLGRMEHESIAVRGQRMDTGLGLGPRLDDVPPAPGIARHICERDAVLLGAGGPHRLVRRRDDHVRFVEGGIDRFAVDRQVLACLDEFVFFSVELQPAALGVPGPRVGDLFVAHRLGRRAVVHQRRDALHGQPLQFRRVVALGGAGEVEHALQVDVGLALAHELPIVVEPLVAGQFGHLRSDQRQHFDVAQRVEDPRQRGARKDG